MKKIWFKRKLYGWGWTFGTWESYVVMALYIALSIYIFFTIDQTSHSASDTLINFLPRFILLSAILFFISWWKGETPHWQWGKRKEDLKDVLKRGGIAVIATDTTYGIVGSALREQTVHEIYRLRKRDPNKPLIVLISEKKDLEKFGVETTEAQEKILEQVWPGPASIILRAPSPKFAYLHRGTDTLAFRLPSKEALRNLLQEVGPLVAPSANPQGHLVARNIEEARAYFGSEVDFYQDGGEVTASASKIIDITDGTAKIIRS